MSVLWGEGHTSLLEAAVHRRQLEQMEHRLIELWDESCIAGRPDLRYAADLRAKSMERAANLLQVEMDLATMGSR